MKEAKSGIKRILIVDDEPVIGQMLSQILGEKYCCVQVRSAEQALEVLAGEQFNLVISDIQMPGLSGLEMTPRVRELSPDTVVIMISGEQSIESAIKAMRAGAFDFITKPFTLEHVEAVVERGLEYQGLLLTKRHYENHLEELVRERTEELHQQTEELHQQISERRRVEVELSDAQIFLRKVLDTVPNSIFVKDIRGNFVLVNQALAEIFGTTVENLIGKTDADFSHNPDEAQLFTDQDIKQLENLEDKFIHEEKHTDIFGNVHWFQTFKRSIVLGENKTKYLVGVATDLTERRLLESQLRHSQKLESIGQMAAGIAHEINTPTQYVGDNTRFLCDAFNDILPVLAKYHQLLDCSRTGLFNEPLIGEIEAEIQKADLEYLTAEIPTAIKQSLDGVSRIALIVQSMKDFAHPGSKEVKNADLNKAIASTITVASNEWKYVAELETRFDEDLPPVPCLLGEFNQVVLNMITNAAHAIADVVGDGSSRKGKLQSQPAKLVRNGRRYAFRIPGREFRFMLNLAFLIRFSLRKK